MSGTTNSSSGSVAPFYASDSFWNTPIGTSSQLASNSAAMVSTALTPYANGANFANGAYGIGLAYATNSDPTYTISGMQYYNSGPITFHIPKGAQPSTGSDHHLVVINGSQELDLWDASYNAASNTWSAGSAFVENIDGWGANAAPGQKAGGDFASGFSGMGGVVRPEEIAQGHIDHALSVMIPMTLANYIAAPATATDGRSTNANAIPEGAHIQLDPSFNVDAQNWPTWEKVIAKALQTYGAYVSDTGGSVALYGQTDANGGMTWAQAGVPNNPSLNSLPWQDMRVLSVPASSTGTATGPESTGYTGGATTSATTTTTATGTQPTTTSTAPQSGTTSTSTTTTASTTTSSQPTVVPSGGSAPVSAPVTTATINPTPGSNTMTGTAGKILFNATSGGETVTAGGNGNVINGGAGDNITVTGHGNWIAGNPGSETVTDNGGSNTIVLPAASQGTDQIYGNVLQNGDAFDLRASLAGTGWNGQASTLSSYIQASSRGNTTTITLTPQGAGGAGSTLAVLHGVGRVSTDAFLSHVIA